MVEGIGFTHNLPIPKGFVHIGLFKGHPRPPKPLRPKRGVNQVPKQLTSSIAFSKSLQSEPGVSTLDHKTPRKVAPVSSSIF